MDVILHIGESSGCDVCFPRSGENLTFRFFPYLWGEGGQTSLVSVWGFSSAIKKKKKLTWHHLHRCKYRKQVGVLNLLTYFLKPLLERILFTKHMRQWAEMWSSFSFWGIGSFFKALFSSSKVFSSSVSVVIKCSLSLTLLFPNTALS